MLIISHNLLIFFILFFIIIGCDNPKEYEIKNYYPTAEADTILVNIVTYISKKPKTADWKTRLEPRFRKYYINQLPDFKIKNYYVSEDSLHYFYIIRPARSPRGHERGVGGTFKMKENFRLVDFEENFNTPVMSLDSLNLLGDILFQELISKGNVDKYIENKSFVEWPDAQLKYDNSINEWVYRK
ncbi:MAG: hypothetical protein M3421_01795 [Bacteroidota bacterium]|nr:hypothetical protein [Bacteroidota bacterium]